jgi:hypothetical protein
MKQAERWAAPEQARIPVGHGLRTAAGEGQA